MNLLSTNAKLEKQNGIDYLVAGLSMAPHGIGGYQACESATSGCKSSCVLWFTGRTVMPKVRNAMIRRKQMFFEHRSGFLDLLRADINTIVRRAENRGLSPAVRLNVATDLDWSDFAAEFPNCTFYDYTKVRSRLLRSDWPPNYQLTYSLNERSHGRTVQSQLERGGNVAVVFSTRYFPQRGLIGDLPESWKLHGKHYRVIDGDRYDMRLRELDGSGIIVGLRFKGSLKRRQHAIENGFCIDAGHN